MRIVNVEQMRALEQAADAQGHSYAAMMDRAGQAVADMAVRILPGQSGNRVLILVGPGNNGGDGLVAARHLLERDQTVTIYLWKRPVKGDANFARLKRRRRGITIYWANNDPDWATLRAEVAQAHLIIDALLGTGVTRPIEGSLAQLLGTVRQGIEERRHALLAASAAVVAGMPRFPVQESIAFALTSSGGLPRGPLPSSPEDDWEDEWEDEWEDFPPEDEAPAFEETLPEDWDDFDEDVPPYHPFPPCPVLAVDCPSGLNCDTGALDPAALAAQATVTFAYPKWGQQEYPGAGACGLLMVADIGISHELADGITTKLLDPAELAQLWPARPDDAHKGTFGKAMIVAGSVRYTGAAALAAQAAARAGAGLVTLAVPTSLHPILAGTLHEITWLPLPESMGTHCSEGAQLLLDQLCGYDALLIGCGLSTTEPARGFLRAMLGPGGVATEQWRGRAVIDADALNLAAEIPDWPHQLPEESILTPHPGEMARLTSLSRDAINGDRIGTALRFAESWGHVIVLKGAHTVIAAPDGRAAVLPFAVPSLATAGSGDVLAGAIVAMLAQGLAPFEAAACGAYLHAHTGVLLAEELGAAGALAGDLAPRFPRSLQSLRLISR